MGLRFGVPLQFGVNNLKELVELRLVRDLTLPKVLQRFKDLFHLRRERKERSSSERGPEYSKECKEIANLLASAPFFRQSSILAAVNLGSEKTEGFSWS